MSVSKCINWGLFLFLTLPSFGTAPPSLLLRPCSNHNDGYEEQHDHHQHPWRRKIMVRWTNRMCKHIIMTTEYNVCSDTCSVLKMYVGEKLHTEETVWLLYIYPSSSWCETDSQRRDVRRTQGNGLGRGKKPTYLNSHFQRPRSNTSPKCASPRSTSPFFSWWLNAIYMHSTATKLY